MSSASSGADPETGQLPVGVPELLHLNRARDVLVGLMCQFDPIDLVDRSQRRLYRLVRACRSTVCAIEDLPRVPQTSPRLDQPVDELLPLRVLHQSSLALEWQKLGTGRRPKAYTYRMRLRSLLAAAVLAASALAAVPAVAKEEDMRAELDEPVRLNTASGKSLRVVWHLVDQGGRASTMSRFYLRVSRCGGRPLRIDATERGNGRFSVRFKVPKGGIRKLVVALKGWRIIGDETERADLFIPFDPPLVRRCP